MAELLRLPRRLYRAVLVVLLLLLVAGMATVVGLSLGRIRPEPLASWWLRRLVAVLRLDIHWQGDCDPQARVVVANHVSWLDIVVIGSRLPVRFVSKHEVREWPVIGWLSQAAGAFYIRRGSGGAKLLVERLHPHLESGGSVVFFPEGTTTLGDGVLRFRARLFEAAVATESPVQPIALRYGDDAASRRLAAFIGDDDFLSHLWALLGCKRVTVRVQALDSLAPGSSRDVLAQSAHESISQALSNDAPRDQEVATATKVGRTESEPGTRRKAEALN